MSALFKFYLLSFYLKGRDTPRDDPSVYVCAHASRPLKYIINKNTALRFLTPSCRSTDSTLPHWELLGAPPRLSSAFRSTFCPLSPGHLTPAPAYPHLGLPHLVTQGQPGDIFLPISKTRAVLPSCSLEGRSLLQVSRPDFIFPPSLSRRHLLIAASLKHLTFSELTCLEPFLHPTVDHCPCSGPLSPSMDPITE